MVEIPIDRAIAEAAGRLRRSRGITTPDALIAATALERELSLVTPNEADRRLTATPASNPYSVIS